MTAAPASPVPAHTGSRRAILAALFANLGIAVAKFTAFALTRSAAMLSEAIHSLADTGNQLLLLLGGRRAARRADAEHPFGYARETYFWAFVVSMLLFSLGGAFALYEGIGKLRHPHAHDGGFGVAIAVLAVALVLEGASLRTAIGEADVHRRGRSWFRFIKTTKNPELPVVLLEDSGALLGLVLALGGVTLTHLTGDARFDAAASVAIGLLLCVISLVLAAEMRKLLVGESADDAELAAIRAAALGVDGIEQVVHVRAEHRGAHELLVELKVVFSSALGADDVARITNAVEVAVRRAVPSARWLSVEAGVA